MFPFNDDPRTACIVCKCENKNQSKRIKKDKLKNKFE